MQIKSLLFSITIPSLLIDIVLGPGPKYMLPDGPRGPFFSFKWRTKLRKADETPGPYYIKPIADAPAFSMYGNIFRLFRDFYLLVLE